MDEEVWKAHWFDDDSKENIFIELDPIRYVLISRFEREITFQLDPTESRVYPHIHRLIA